MSIHGNPSVTAYFGAIGRYFNKIRSIGIPEAFKVPLFVSVGVCPAFAGSLLFKEISPLFVVASLVATYAFLGPIQDRLFEFSPKEKQWAITLPVHVLFLAWAAVLAGFNNAEQIGRTVGAMVLIVAVSIWPVYMGKKGYERKSRKVPFKMAYTITAIVIIIQQALITARRF